MKMHRITDELHLGLIVDKHVLYTGKAVLISWRLYTGKTVLISWRLKEEGMKRRWQ
jgi:hypothetical protein